MEDFIASENPLQIKKKDIPSKFLITNENEKYKLQIGKAKPIIIRLPFNLDKDIAKICAMIMDGSLGKKFEYCSFSQKKDKSKIEEFSKIVEEKFDILGIKRKGNNEIPSITFSNKTLATFLYYCLDVHKSDEEARIPRWIWNSPLDIIKEYIRYAFAMEGSISDSRKGKKEIRFHSCDKSYLKQLSELLKNKFLIKSKVYTYFIKGYGKKYFLSFTNKESILKFSKIGFALLSHQNRLEDMINSYRNKAWEITLVSVTKLRKKNFHINDINKLFPYLCKRAIHWRLTQLVQMGYLELDRNSYLITKLGKEKNDLIKSSVKISKLYTNPRENEIKILDYLNNGENSISQIARDLRMNTTTVRDVLRRLEKSNKVKLVKIDKFQRKIWKKVDSEGSPKTGYHQTFYGFEPSTFPDF